MIRKVNTEEIRRILDELNRKLLLLKSETSKSRREDIIDSLYIDSSACPGEMIALDRILFGEAK